MRTIRAFDVFIGSTPQIDLRERSSTVTTSRTSGFPAAGFGEVWRPVVADFVERRSPGGPKFSVDDGGARPDAVARTRFRGVPPS